MPLYDLKCTACGHTEERFLKFSNLDSQNCSVCGEPAKQVVSPLNFNLKGIGWERDGYQGGGSE